MEEHVVVSVTDEVTESGTELWRVVMDTPGGGRTHIFPKMILDARAAEYGIDPGDVNTLLDIVLHEPFIPHPEDPALLDVDPAAKKGLVTKAPQSRGRVRKGDTVPAWLFNADSIDQAREAHLERIRHAKETRVKVTAPKGLVGKLAADPLDIIRQAHRPDHAVIEWVRSDVANERRRIRGERVSIPADTNRPTLPQIVRGKI